MTSSSDGTSQSNLISRDISVGGRAAEIRLSRYYWDSLDEICAREGCNIDELCTMLDRERQDCALTDFISLFIVAYFRERDLRGGSVHEVDETPALFDDSVAMFSSLTAAAVTAARSGQHASEPATGPSPPDCRPSPRFWNALKALRS